MLSCCQVLSYRRSWADINPSIFQLRTLQRLLSQFRRFQIFVFSFPSFGRGFDSGRPLQIPKAAMVRFPGFASFPGSGAGISDYG
jgi:hypothetical protein